MPATPKESPTITARKKEPRRLPNSVMIRLIPVPMISVPMIPTVKAAVVALEDKKYNTHSFDTYEAAEAVYDAINEYVGGLLTCNTEPDDDGRNDAWA